MKRRNFTLVELVVAMGIFLLVATIIGTASATFYNAYNRTVKATAKLQNYLLIDQVMDQCVRNAIPFKWEDDKNDRERFVFQGAADSLLFAALRRSYSGDRGALIFVRLRLIDTDLVAEYSPYPLLPWLLEEEEDNEELYTREVLAQNVQAISFLYAERDTEGAVEFLTEWVEDEHDSIPLAIQLEIEWLDGHRERWLRRTAGSAANASFGNRPDQSGLEKETGRGGIR